MSNPTPIPSDEIELSVVMPCLNEADTLATCIRKAQTAMEQAGIRGEVVIADNGSTDASPDIARELGARLVPVSERGYGCALQGGIRAARGRYVLMGDADDSYDFLEIPKFVVELRKGVDLVQGCRLPSGGGTVKPGAMPFLHRYLGNPVLSMMVRIMFAAPIHDVYCGMRAFTKDLYERLDLRCPGMEFATEMIIKSSLMKVSTAEVPITLHPDGRKSHPPHLRTFRDGWRTLRFFLMSSPKWLFFYPGLLAIALGLIGYTLALPGVKVMGASLDAHTLLCASLSILLGFQSVSFALFAATYAAGEGLLPESPWARRVSQILPLERGLVLGTLACLGGLLLILMAALQWSESGFGQLNYAHTMRVVIPGVTLTCLGFQTILGSFMQAILRMGR